MLDRQPADAVAAGDGADVDLLAGTNTEEGNLYLAPFGNPSTSTAADADAIAARSHPRPGRFIESRLLVASTGIRRSQPRPAARYGTADSAALCVT
ncbi:hypothetical protein ABZ914_24380 [Spirillospora sp. NPDC046719]